MSQKEKIIKIYKKEDIAKTFDRDRSKYAYEKYKHKIEANFLKKAINKVKSENIKILDIGCGTGRMLPVIFKTKKKIKYSGLDTSDEMLKELRKKDVFKKQKKSIALILSDATKLPFKENTFDVVYTYHLLWHIPIRDQKKIILEMKRVVKKEGLIIFDVLNRDFIWEKLKKYFGKEKAEGLYKQNLSEVKEIIGEVDKIEMEKLSDAIIKKDRMYRLFNIINISRNFLPSSLFHMIYFKIKK